jgi:DNA-binding Lrp family transcriptional regulator
MKKLKGIDYSIIAELLKNSRISDRKLAKKIGTSQPTVTRRREHLEKELSIDYTAIPDFGDLGFEILAFTFASWNHEAYADERVPEAISFLSDHPNILFVSTGSGMNSDRICISIHKDYGDYSKLMNELRTEWGKYFTTLSSFIISLKSDNILRQHNLKQLGLYLKQHNVN